MTYSAEPDLKRLTRWRTQRIYELAAAGEPDRIHGSLLVAIASRETNCRNIVGGGSFVDGQWVPDGSDRGLFQISSRWHERWLRSVPGCLSGEYAEAYSPAKEGGEGAYPPGRVPGLSTATRKAISILRWNCTWAEKNGIREEDVLRVAVAGYNRGAGSAVNAYLRGEDPDAGTTGGNYAKDVLVRQRKIRSWVKNHGWA